jgi:hypothetical protein
LIHRIDGNPNNDPSLLNLLTLAADALRPKSIDEYVWLRSFIRHGIAGDRAEFERRFRRYYGLNSAGLTPQFKETYFKLLFNHKPARSDDPHTPILLRLYEIPRWQKDQVVAASFVSKLVAIHDESQPLYDRHVRAFFGVGVPSVGPVKFQIAGFLQNLMQIRRTYEVWNQTPEIGEIIAAVQSRYPGLSDAHPNRICDFLVWATGARMGRRRTT